MDIYQFSFEKLEVWQLARQLAGSLYQATRTFPRDEKFSLISQIRRAAVSVTANIAEGTTRVTPRDQAHFTTIAFSSLMEVYNHLIIAKDLGYVKDNDLADYRKKIQPLSVKLSNLKTSQLKRIGKIGFLWLLLVSPHVLQQLEPLSL